MKSVKSHVERGREGWFSLIVEVDSGCVENFEDLTEDLARLEQFSKRINEGELHSVHIYDVLEDFLG